jgi:two-component system NtrC family sensor kinase
MTTFDRIRHFWTGSISRRLLLGVCGLVTLVMTAFAYSTISRQHDFLEQQAVQRGIALTETLAVNSVSWILTNDLSGLADVVAAARKYPNLNYIMVTARDGKVLAHSDAAQVGRYVNNSEIVAKQSGPARARHIRHTDTVLVTVAPIAVEGRVIGWAHISEDHAQVEQSMRDITREGIYFGLVAILVAGLIVGTATRSLTRGLNELVGVTQRIAAGDTSTRGIAPRGRTGRPR